MKRFLIRISLFIALLTLPAGHLLSTNSHADWATVLTCVDASRAAYFTTIGLDRWKDQVRQRTGGAVAFSDFEEKHLAAPSRPEDILDAVIAGRLDIACLGIPLQSDRFITAGCVALPLSISNARLGSSVFLSLVEKYQPKEFQNVKMLTLFTSAPANLITSVSIKNPRDMVGLDFHASGATAGLLAALGANPVIIPSDHRLDALQQGIVKGVLASLETLKDLDYARCCRHVTLTNTTVYPFIVVMNRDAWRRLPDTVKQVMDNLAAEHSDWMGAYIDRHVQEAIDWSGATYGVRLSRLSPEQEQNWNHRLEGITADWVARARAQGVDAEAMLSDAKAMAGRQK